MEDKKNYQTTRIKKKSLDKLRIIAAITHETQVQIIERLAEAELERLNRTGQVLPLLNRTETL